MKVKLIMGLLIISLFLIGGCNKLGYNDQTYITPEPIAGDCIDICVIHNDTEVINSIEIDCGEQCPDAYILMNSVEYLNWKKTLPSRPIITPKELPERVAIVNKTGIFK